MNHNRLIGKIRLWFGFCPKCNSDAPHLYSCPVCEYNEAPKEYWWNRFIMWRQKKDMPTFINPIMKKGGDTE